MRALRRGLFGRCLSLFLAFTFLGSVIFSAAPFAGAETLASTSTASSVQASTGSSATVVDGASTEASSDPLGLVSSGSSAVKSGADEIVSRRTSHSRTFDNGDGTYVLQSYLSRVNYYDEKTKQYEPVDASLEPATRDSKQVFQNRADAYTVALPSICGSGEWVSVESTAGSLSYRPSADETGAIDASPSRAMGALTTSAHDTVGYSKAFGAAADLEYVSSSEGLKESIVLPVYTGVTRFGFDLKTVNLTPALQDNGSIWLTSADAKAPVFIIPAPTMTDSLQNEGDEAAFSDKCRYALTKTDAGWHLDVIADAGWLSDPARVYPVKIDPCVIYQNYGTYQADGFTAAMDAFITTQYPNTNYGASYDSNLNHYQLKTGYYPGSGNNRTLIFPDLSTILAWNNSVSHLKILTANMNLACYWRYDHGSGPVYYGPITSGWGESTVTWNNQPSFSDLGLSDDIAEGDRTRFVATDYVQGWMDGTLPCAGFEFWGGWDATGDWTKLYARENATDIPVFECWFTTDPTTPSPAYLAPSETSAAPSVSWVYHDDMSKPQKYANIEMRQTGGSTVWGLKSNGTATTSALPTPDGGWADGGSYDVRVQTVGDITGYGDEAPSAWSAWTTFRYLVAPRAATTATTSWFTETDTNADGINDARNDTNTSGRGSVSLSWNAVTGATGYNIFLYDGVTFRQVASTTATSWATSGKGLYPSDTAIEALPNGTGSNPFLAGTGLDLRDDPRGLYAKTAGLSGSTMCAYKFKVAPCFSSGQLPLASVPAAYATLDNRTVHLADDARHTAYELGDLLRQSGSLHLERGSLELAATDLSISSYGPQASLTRHYSSSVTASTSFTQGWRFNFEQTLVVNGNSATYTDENGEVHQFRQVTTPVVAASGGTVTTPGSTTIHTFTSSGSFVVNTAISGASVLVVGGGGGGGIGGGGGGGVVSATQNLSPGTLSVTVGAGGTGNQGGGQNYGADSWFNGVGGYGGGGGAGWACNGFPGGSGGGGGHDGVATYGGSPTRGYGGSAFGNSGGGNSGFGGPYYPAGGGGGAGAGGAGAPNSSTGGAGGSGIYWSVTGGVYGAGGGGGVAVTGSAGGAGGTGGGGRGANGTVAPTGGTAGTGSGGGGGSNNYAGGNGGSGVVIVAYPTPAPVTSWVSASGFDGTIAQSGSDWTITYKDGTVCKFDGTSHLIKTVTDKNNNVLTYDRTTANHVKITAANGNLIDVTLSNGVVTAATYTASSVTRTVTFNKTAGTVAYSYSDGSPGCTLSYTYTNDVITHLQASQSDAIANESGSTASWDFTYAAGKVTLVTAPHHDSSSRAVTSVSYGTDANGLAEATVSQSGEVSGQTAAVNQVFGMNGNGTCAYRTNLYVAGASAPTWSYTYSAGLDVAREQNPDGGSTGWVYDQRGNLLCETDTIGRVTSHTYDASNNEITTVDPKGSLTTRAFDSHGNMTSETQTLSPGVSAVTLHQYDGQGRETLSRQKLYVDGNGVSHYKTVQNTYGQGIDDPTQTDTYGETSMDGVNFTHENVALGPQSSTQQLTETASFDGFGNKLSSTDASSTTTNYSYDAAGRQLTSTDPAETGRQNRIVNVSVYDGLGRQIASYRKTTDTNVVEYRTYDIDGFGRTISTKSWLTPSGIANATLDHTDSATFDAMGRQTTASNSLATGGPATYWHDAMGNVVRGWAAGLAADEINAKRMTFDAEGKTLTLIQPTTTVGTVTSYNADGSVHQVTSPDSTVVIYGYDACGNNVAETAQDNSVTMHAYDLAGRLVSTTDSSGLVTTCAYDLAGRQTGSEGDIGDGSSTTYNVAGWVISKTDADGIRTDDVYDACGRVLAETTDSKTARNAYDAHGSVLTQTDQDGNVVSNTYDAFERVARTQETASGVVIKDTTTSYDTLSRVGTTADTKTGIAMACTYPTSSDPRMSTALTVAGITATATVDALGSEISRVASGTGVNLARSVTATDAAGRIKGWALGSIPFTRAFDAVGHETTQTGLLASPATYGYGTTGTGAGKKVNQNLPLLLGGTFNETFGYNLDGRLISDTVSGLSAGSYAYDISGNVTAFTPVGGSASVLSYDGSGRLSSLSQGGTTVTQYAYNTANGWRTSQGPVVNPSAVTFGYTNCGGLSSYTSSGAGISAAYTYDASGQRRTSSVTSGSTTTATTYTYQGITLLSLAATSTAGEVSDPWSTTYLYDSEGHPYAGVYKGGSPVVTTVFAIVTNDHGDVIELADTSGAAFASYRYDVWGRPLGTSTQATSLVNGALASAIASRQVLRYAGYVFDAESGMYYCSARTYDPATMQFLQKDPAKADGEESAYQYCGGDPVGKVDPSGCMFCVFDGFNLYGYRYIGYDRYRLAFKFRAVTGNLTLPEAASGESYATAGPIPSGEWYFLQNEWRRRTYLAEVRARKSLRGYAPMGGWYVPLHAASGTITYGRGSLYLHSYDNKTWHFQQTLGCIRIEPWNMGTVKKEGSLDSDGKIPIYIEYPGTSRGKTC